MIIVGRVVSGLGEGRRYIEIYMDVIERALGIKPYPGTLNIEVVSGDPDIFAQSRDPVVINPPKPGYGEVYACKARLNGVDVFLIRPVKTKHDINIIEVISDKCLRESLGLRDGDTVIIEI